jgi:hypothetical protein
MDNPCPSIHRLIFNCTTIESLEQNSNSQLEENNNWMTYEGFEP